MPCSCLSEFPSFEWRLLIFLKQNLKATLLLLFYRSETIVKSASVNFKLNQEVLEVSIDGRKLKTTFSLVMITDEDGTEFPALIQDQIDSSNRRIQVIRFIREDRLHVIMKVNGVVGKAIFEP